MARDQIHGIYFCLFKNVVIYFIIGIILISIISFSGRYFNIKGYKISDVIEWANNIVLYILPILLGIFTAVKGGRHRIKSVKLKLLWVAMNCFINYVVFRIIAMCMLIVSFIVFPLPS